MAAPSIQIEFADGEYSFSLPFPQQKKLEEVCGFTDDRGWRRPKGIVAIFADTIAGLAVVDGTVVAVPEIGRASAVETRAVIIQGLIGGGYGYVDGERVNVDEIKARKLVEEYVDSAPLVRRWTLAGAVLKTAIYEDEIEPVKKKQTRPVKRRTRKNQPTSSASSATA